ncbi:MAG TPA: winged helix-turn-helix domain-containing protein, partial [Chthonomonadaceae bacterium]|nr:winged helix-turn-helix domain-containing protein [Chthonomonadaceae bacterium]
MMWSMNAQIDAVSSSPLVTAIAGTLTQRIHAGQYPGKEGLPSERELAVEFGVSRTLIRKVLDTLEAQHLILRAPRCRTLV